MKKKLEEKTDPYRIKFFKKVSNSVYRHPIKYNDKDFLDEEKLYKEIERAFEICHGCRRCFNLCDSFPTLFDLIDNTTNGILEEVNKKDYEKVTDSCTLCDLCYNIKCPYIPPHEFDLDFPKLMLRHKAFLKTKRSEKIGESVLNKTDITFPLSSQFSKISNKLTSIQNNLGRKILSKTSNIHPNAYLPKFQKETLVKYAKINNLNEPSPQKVIVYATCLGNYSEVELGKSALNVLKSLGIKAQVLYPECCGMPLLEKGDIQPVAKKALKIASFFKSYVDEGYKIIPLVPSCTLMLKNEWRLLHPENEDIKKLSENCMDLCESVVFYGKEKDVFQSLDEKKSILIHLACHARAQNQGAKAAEMLRLVKGLKVKIIDRCSGHGGSFGTKNNTHDIAHKVGKQVADAYKKNSEDIDPIVISECPLAGHHIHQGLEADSFTYKHPIQILEKYLK